MKTKIKTEIMKLELKHLAPYLPYGLTVLLGTTERNITAVSTDSKFVFVDAYKGSRDKQMAGIESIKPILRPLSDLTKVIEYKGESVRSIDYISTTKANSQRIMRRVANQQNLDCLEYWQFERLLSLHFDVFGLIEAGLAIDINT